MESNLQQLPVCQVQEEVKGTKMKRQRRRILVFLHHFSLRRVYKRTASKSISAEELNLDKEISEIETSICQAESQLEDLEAKSRLRAKQDKLSKVKKQLDRKQKKLKSAQEEGEKKTFDIVKVTDLRNNDKLLKTANEKLAKLGLFHTEEDYVDPSLDSFSSSSASSSDSYGIIDPFIPETSLRKRKKKHSKFLIQSPESESNSDSSAKH